LPKTLTKEILKKITDKYGDAFYLLDSDVFEESCKELLASFRGYYPKSNIAYSYKTNYTPRLVQIVDKLGGFAEVVSEMEMEVALRAGISPAKIIWNGPIKNKDKVKELLLMGGTVNIDSIREIDNICEVAKKHPDHVLNVGVRLNYDVGDGVLSRFGFDVDGEDFDTALKTILTLNNVKLIGLQVHFAKRSPDYWTARAEGMLRVYDYVVEKYGLQPQRLDIGGGIYGHMPDDFREQLKLGMFTFDDYSSRAAKLFAEHFDGVENAPELFIEPGTAVAANCMRFVCQIHAIKDVRGKKIATTNGSQKNISMSGLNPPMEIVCCSKDRQEYKNLDIAGYTCIESDYLYKGYTGQMGIGDYIILGCCGSYSIGMKPPFILPNVPVVDISADDVELIKRAENFDDLFHTFSF